MSSKETQKINAKFQIIHLDETLTSECPVKYPGLIICLKDKLVYHHVSCEIPGLLYPSPISKTARSFPGVWGRCRGRGKKAFLLKSGVVDDK